jgi:hypothetical protein
MLTQFIKFFGEYPQRGTVYFLKNDWAYTQEWQLEDFTAMGQRIQKKQVEMLEYVLENQVE